MHRRKLFIRFLTSVTMAASFTAAEVAKHNTPNDNWVIIHGKVFDITAFQAEHPGGKKVLANVAGSDATKQFDQFHNMTILQRYTPKLQVGSLVSEMQSSSSSSSSVPHALSYSKNTDGSESFGELIPYGDPNWYQEWHSSYYNDSHRRFRSAVRDFVEKEITPKCHEWDEAKRMPLDIWKKCYEAGWLPGVSGGWPTELAGSNIAGGVKPSEWDAFHEFILYDEVSRCGSGGVTWGLFVGLCIGLPPVLHYGSKYLQQKVAPCLRGEAVICLCITEPAAGSDVANLKATATLTPDGKHYIVNGEKKWITNGVYSDFFTVAVRTGGSGMKGISLLLLEKSMPGLTTRQMQCSGVWPSGTTYISMEDVKVPVENLIGKENEGFKYVMSNFNHERWMIATLSNRMARVCMEEALKYACKRKTFGQRLIDHQVIRFKVGNMARQIESTHAWLEQITHQMTKMTHKEQAERLAGPMALCKAHCSLVFEYCAREAAQIFGGLAYTRGGQGEKVERLYREVRAFAIPAGSEEIMIDLGVRQAMRRAKL